MSHCLPVAKRFRPTAPRSPLYVNVRADGSTHGVRVTLCEPGAGGETCPITGEPMGCPDPQPYAPAGTRAVRARPELTCAALPCGHRFDAIALLSHFLRNRMQCPMCRAGIDAPMSVQASPPLGREPWILAAQRQISTLRAEEALQQHGADQALAHNVMMEQMLALRPLLLPSQREALASVPLRATFLLHQEAGALPTRAMETGLHLADGHRVVFELPSENRRSLTAEIRSSGARRLGVEIHIDSAVRVEIASISNMLLEGNRSMVYMEDMTSSVQMDTGAENEINHFAYVPGGPPLINIFHEAMPLSELVHLVLLSEPS